MAIEKMSEKMTLLTKICLTVAIVGAINWGLVGFFNWNLVDAIFGGGAHEVTSGLSRVIYALVGLCGLALIAFWPRLREAVRPPVTTSQRAEVRP